MPPRTLIMKFLNYKEKLTIIAAAQAKKDIQYKDQQVRFYSDVAMGVHQLRKQFGSVRQELCNLGIRHINTFVTHKDCTYPFKLKHKSLLRRFKKMKHKLYV